MGLEYLFLSVLRIFQAIPEEHSTDDSSLHNDDSNNPKLFTQAELNDLVRDLNLPKEYSEIFGFQIERKESFGRWNVILLVS